MSVLTANGFLTPVEADAYVAALLGLLGDRDPLDVLQKTPAALGATVKELTAAHLGRPEAPGKWSIKEVIAHLADAELVGAFRLRLILTHDQPRLTPYDQDLWANRLDYAASDVGGSLEQFTSLRHANLRIWRRLTPTDLARFGLHAERGEESLDRMRRQYAGHDLAHLQQIERIRRRVTGD
jgi:hypothetical protein